MLQLPVATGRIVAAPSLRTAIVAAAIGFGCDAQQVWADADSRPNIVVIMSDDMGYSDIGCYGGEIRTPTLDRLAGNGLRFTQFYNTARCCPTRASLLTGLYPHQAGVGWMMNDNGLEGYQGNLNKSCMTIAEVLKSAGYKTYMSGKWHVTRHVNPDGFKFNWPLQRGFDRFYGTIHGAGSFFDPNSLTRDNTLISPYADPEYQPEQYYYTDAISDNAVRFINENPAEDPFFLYVSYTAAHWPMHALDSDIKRYKGKYDAGYHAIRKARFERMKKLGVISHDAKLSPPAEDWSKVENRDWELRCMEVYAAMVESMDRGIGRIISTLEKKSQLDNTLIFFLQDNGGCAETLGRKPRGKWTSRPDKAPLAQMAAGALQPDMIPKQTRDGFPVVMGPGIMPGPADTYIAYGRGWANVSNTPFREYKHWVHEGGISTPLIAHWPRQIKRANQLDHQPGHLIDIMATCVDVSRATYPDKHRGQPIKPLEGRSLGPAFAGKEIEREALYWEHEGNRAVRVGRWKLVAKGANGAWELYDIENDRSELTNLADEQPKRVAELAARWQAYAERANVLPLVPYYKKRGNKVSFSKKKRFQLSAGADLAREKAPFVEGKSFVVTANLANDAGNGVIVAQGGVTDGWSLYVNDGTLAFATRHQGKLSVVASRVDATKSRHQISATLHKDGKVTILIDGKTVANGSTPGPMVTMPLDGLQVGRDLHGAVGKYEAPFRFDGTIESVTLSVAD